MADAKDDSGDESEFGGQDWVFYCDRPEWKDVRPIPQDDDSDCSIVSINYSDKFRDVYDYFRAVVNAKEKSERVLQLTKDALELNPANYTVWQYRRETLKALNKDLLEEMTFIQLVIEQHPKNYQVWHHRRVLVEWINDGTTELPFTANILQQDAKNYHAWQHRQWAMKTFNLFDGELDYVDQLLDNDLRNNSAWNQRYFVINNTTGFTEEVYKREVNFTLAKIECANENESAWNYLRSLLMHDKEGLNKNNTISKFCENLYKSGCRSPFLLATIVDMCEEYTTSGAEDSWYTMKLAHDLCDELANEQDTIRAKYWNHISENLPGSEKKESSSSPAGAESNSSE